MAAFSSPAAMFDAVAMQRGLHSQGRELPEDGKEICIRVGFHFGPALAQDADHFGDTVNVAARVVGIANGRQIITTMECARMIEHLQQRMTELSIGCQSRAKQRRSRSSRSCGKRRTTRRGRWDFRRDQRSSVGRSRAGQRCRQRGPSRLAATRHDRAAQSQLGHRCSPGGDHLLLRHAELILHGSGRFGFGHSTPDADNDPHLVQFALSSTIGIASNMTG